MDATVRSVGPRLNTGAATAEPGENCSPWRLDDIEAERDVEREGYAEGDEENGHLAAVACSARNIVSPRSTSAAGTSVQSYSA